MCLTVTKKIKPTEDIVCYKCVRVYTLHNSYAHVSPFYKHTVWIPNVTNHIKPAEREIILNKEPQKNDMIESGAFHTYKNLSDAEAEATAFGLRVLECVIPKESMYVYEGLAPRWSQTLHEYIQVPGYASQRLRPVKLAFKHEKDCNPDVK